TFTPAAPDTAPFYILNEDSIIYYYDEFLVSTGNSFLFDTAQLSVDCPITKKRPSAIVFGNSVKSQRQLHIYESLGSSKVIRIEYSNTSVFRPASLYIYSAIGQELLSSYVNTDALGNGITLDLKFLPSGFYYCAVSIEGIGLQSASFIIE
ncbi:MAG TPA: hypothetical protein VG537_02395, partial [Candidatus Kapabacteria bacterium]|nr:hypothetical protein [Candidatus Kapabacteria bacterium]